MSTPAGWYPQSDGQQRYWDGQQWTENFAPGAPLVTPPVAARKNWFLRHKILSAIGALLLFGMFANLANGGNKSVTIAPVGDQVATSATSATPDQAAADHAAADKAAADQAAADQAAANQAAADKAAADKVVADKAAAAKAVAAKAAAAKAAAAKAAEAAKPKFTTAQENAIRTGKDYIDAMGFSRSGLIHQLSFDGYSAKDATVAVDYMKVNWNNQAARTAKDYIDAMGFSRSGLINQLIFDGYTKTQATYGTNSVGL